MVNVYTYAMCKMCVCINTYVFVLYAYNPDNTKYTMYTLIFRYRISTARFDLILCRIFFLFFFFSLSPTSIRYDKDRRKNRRSYAYLRIYFIEFSSNSSRVRGESENAFDFELLTSLFEPPRFRLVDLQKLTKIKI